MNPKRHIESGSLLFELLASVLANVPRTLGLLLFLPVNEQLVDRLHHRSIGIIFACRQNDIGIMLHYVQVDLGVLV
jgi:hypothetical protein